MVEARETLARKGSDVLTTEPTATVLAATHRMNDHRVGAVVVTDDGRIVGISPSETCSGARLPWSARRRRRWCEK